MIKLKDYFFDRWQYVWFGITVVGFAFVLLSMYLSTTTPELKCVPAPTPVLKSKYELFGSPCEWSWYIKRLDRCTR